MQQIESIKYSVWNRLSRASTYILDVVVLLAEPVKIRPFSTPTDIIPVKERSIIMKSINSMLSWENYTLLMVKFI